MNNSFNIESSLEHISSLTNKGNQYVTIEFKPTGIVQVHHWVGSRYIETILDENNSVLVCPEDTIQKMLATLADLTSQERWYLLRALEQYPLKEQIEEDLLPYGPD